MFCQVGQGYGGRGGVALGRRGEGNTLLVCLVSIHYFNVVFITWGGGVPRYGHYMALLTIRSHLGQDLLSPFQKLRFTKV